MTDKQLMLKGAVVTLINPRRPDTLEIKDPAGLKYVITAVDEPDPRFTYLIAREDGHNISYALDGAGDSIGSLWVSPDQIAPYVTVIEPVTLEADLTAYKNRPDFGVF